MSRRGDSKLCKKLGQCGHACILSRVHIGPCKCSKTCIFKLGCDHRCAKTCSQPHGHQAASCKRRCPNLCMHGMRCKSWCGKPCIPCKKACPLGCKLHKTCRKRCGNAKDCEMPRGCEARCTLACESCSTPCVGLCGHTCPPCVMCNPFSCPISQETFDSEQVHSFQAYTLSDCGCSFELEALDKYVELEAKKDLFRRSPIKCLTCAKPILTSHRYAPEIRKLMQPPPTPPPPAYTPVTISEKRMVVDCLNKDFQTTSRWYQCPDGHPFFVTDCGNPNQLSYCSECKKRIGSDGKDFLSERWAYIC